MAREVRRPKPPGSNTIPKSSIHMHHVQELRLLSDNSAVARGFRNCGVSTPGHWECTTINPVSIKTGLDDVFVIAEMTTAQGTVEFLGHPASLSVGPIGTIARANPWECRTRPMNQLHNLITKKCGQEPSWQRVGGHMRGRRRRLKTG